MSDSSSASPWPPALSRCWPPTGRPRWRGLDLRGALLATASLGTLVYALTRAQSSGWTSTQTLAMAPPRSPGSPPSPCSNC
jgi:hypothetical protein